MLKLGGAMRRLNLELGTRLVEEGRLESVDDVRLVGNAEVVAMLRGGGPTLDVVAARRRRLDEAELDGPLPRVFDGTPETVQAAVLVGERVEGWGASPGRYEGPARVVRSVTGSTLVRGDVLVARSTDASWAPLFLLAGAIVVEDGGPLSHAAIVARELGMPAVLNVPGIMDRLEAEPDQVALRVDGTSGEVIIHGSSVSVQPDPDHEVGLDPEQEPAPEPELDLTGGGSHAAGREATDLAAGIAPLRRPADPEPGTGMGGFNVFVTGLIGAGALFSTAIALTESMSSRRGRNRLYRKAAPIASTLSEGTRLGFDDERVRTLGVRPRSHYILATLVLFAAAIVLGSASTAAYVADESGRSSSVAFWALSMSGAATLTMLGIYTANAVVQWPHVLPTVRQLAPARPGVEGTWFNAIGQRRAFGIAALLAVVAVLGVFATFGESVLLEIDEPIYEGIDARKDADRYGPDALNWLGRPIVIVPLAIAIGLAAIRCRVIALAFPLAVVAAGLSNVLLGYLVGRERPPFSAHAGELTSFPGGHFMQMMLLFGVVPLAAFIVSGRRWVQVAVGVASAALLALVLTDTFRTGGHWPTDQLGGFLIGGSLVAAIWSLQTSGPHHDSCQDCPAQARPST